MFPRTFIAVILAVLSLGPLAFGDVLRVMGEPSQLTPEGTYFMQPIWSPIGDQLLLAGENYQGLWIIQRQGESAQQISDLMGAGFLPVWDPQGSRIACRVSQVQDKRKLSAIAVYDLAQGTSTELTEYQKEVSLPQWIDRGRKLLFLESGRTTVAEAPGAHKSEEDEEDLVVWTQDGSIVLDRWPQREQTILKPVEKDILWAVPSPDKGRIAFEALGAEIYVVNADGADLVSLGRGERPRWSPDGQWITYMITEDDGHRIISADIYAVHRSGSGRVAVTQTADRLEMNPDWSPDGRMIACDTRGEGAILLIPVEIVHSYPPQR